MATLVISGRQDGRSDDQLRALSAEQGILARADGSAKFNQGKTSVIAAVHGPMQPKFSRNEKDFGAAIEVVFKPHKGVIGTCVCLCPLLFILEYFCDFLVS